MWWMGITTATLRLQLSGNAMGSALHPQHLHGQIFSVRSHHPRRAHHLQTHLWVPRHSDHELICAVDKTRAIGGLEQAFKFDQHFGNLKQDCQFSSFLWELPRSGVKCQPKFQKVKCSATVNGSTLDNSLGGGKQEVGIQAQGVQFGAGILGDLKRKLPFYLSDFTDGFHPKCLATIIFLYFGSLAPCIAFGGLTAGVTAGEIGVVEMIISISVSGITYALMAGQPLTLLAPTGLMVAFTGLLYRATKQTMLPFLPIYAWAGIWTCAFLLCLAAVEASNVIKYFTRFTEETFAALISLGFVMEACKGVGSLFKPTSHFPIATALLSLLLAGSTYVIASFLSQLKTGRLLLRPIRGVLADFGPPLATVIMSLVPPMLFPEIPLPKLAVPASISTTSGRPWLVPLFSIPPWAIFAAAIPAILVTVLIFLDQNITTRLVNDPKYGFQKGEGYHLDLAVLGVLVGLGSIFGLPWMMASTVPSLNHIRSLATTSQSIRLSGVNADEPEENIVNVRENRLTGIVVHVCMGASLLLLPMIDLIPIPVTNGLFLYMGLTSLTGNQFVERVKLWLCDPDLYPDADFIHTVPRGKLHAFTMLQVVCLMSLWTLRTSHWGIMFPLLIMALLPIRNYVATQLVDHQYLALLDAD
ncbi:unnamed protein product [Sphagnum jensenii]|uniref:Bicarbonate transporter-like transmembrane domain-containing protein n=1 Tax=Sphagnum jensenii TaxID=128206 RepID=A0ABP0W8W3_9BRYO